jgi:hypothetical protein
MHYNASSKRVSYTKRVMSIWGGNTKYDAAQDSTLNKQRPNHLRIGFGPGIGVHSTKD